MRCSPDASNPQCEHASPPTLRCSSILVVAAEATVKTEPGFVLFYDLDGKRLAKVRAPPMNTACPPRSMVDVGATIPIHYKRKHSTTSFWAETPPATN